MKGQKSEKDVKKNESKAEIADSRSESGELLFISEIETPIIPTMFLELT